MPRKTPYPTLWPAFSSFGRDRSASATGSRSGAERCSTFAGCFCFPPSFFPLSSVILPLHLCLLLRERISPSCATPLLPHISNERHCNGFVIGIGVFHTVINSADHERYLVPNAKVFKDQVHNITHMHTVRARVSISTPRDVDHKLVRMTLRKDLRRAI